MDSDQWSVLNPRDLWSWGFAMRSLAFGAVWVLLSRGMAPDSDKTNPASPPDAASPPMQDRGLKWWPFIAALVAFAAWLVWLGYLAMHSERWRPS